MFRIAIRVVCLVAVLLGSSQAAAGVIDTFPANFYGFTFGEFTWGSGYQGQMFVAPADPLDSLMLEFSPVSGFGHEDAEFRLLVTPTAGTPGVDLHPASNVLFESPDLSVSLGNGLQQLTVEFGALALSPGDTYLFLLDGFVLSDGTPGLTNIGLRTDDAYPPGYVITSSVTGGDRQSHFAGPWAQGTHVDFAMRLNAIPEPSSVLMALLGVVVFSAFGWRKRQRFLRSPNL